MSVQPLSRVSLATYPGVQSHQVLLLVGGRAVMSLAQECVRGRPAKHEGTCLPGYLPREIDNVA